MRVRIQKNLVILAFILSCIGCSGGGSSTVTTGSIPNPPSDLIATAISTSQIDLQWKDNSFNENGFTIERGIDEIIFVEIATIDGNVKSYIDSNSAISGKALLNASTKYYYRIRAHNSFGSSSYSNTASATTSPAPLTVPAAPTTLSATTISSSQISLIWTDNSDNEEGFKIQRSTNGISFAEIAVVTSNVTSYSNTGLAGGTKFYYRVIAYNSLGDSLASNTANATTFLTPISAPAKPTGLSALAVSSSQINLFWTDNSNNEDEFIVERGTDGINFTKIASVIPGTNMYGNIGLTPLTTYYYRVKASNSVGDSDYSNIASATTLAPALASPNAPSNLTATAISSSQINLTWNDNSNNEDTFRIERGTDGINFSEINSVGVNVTNYNNTGLPASTTWYYRVRARNAQGDSAYSNIAFATTQPPPASIPNAPTGLVLAVISSTQINLSWIDNSDNELGFYVERKTGGLDFTQVATIDPNITTYNDTNLTPSTTYTYRVRAFNSAGNSAYSNEISGTTPLAPLTPPAAPSNLTAFSPSSTSITITWQDNSFNETGFKIERRLYSMVEGGWNQITAVPANTTTYTDTGLAKNTTYQYRVRAYNGAGDSGYSNIATATTGFINP